MLNDGLSPDIYSIKSNISNITESPNPSPSSLYKNADKERARLQSIIGGNDVEVWRYRNGFSPFTPEISIKKK